MGAREHTHMLTVSDVRYSPATRDDSAVGLLGYASFVVADVIVLDGVAIRRTRDGRIVLAFPVKHDRAGREHSLVRPVSNAARQAITRAVIEALQLRAEAPS